MSLFRIPVISTAISSLSKRIFKSSSSVRHSGQLGMNKTERRNLRKRILQAKESSSQSHIYHNLYPFKSKRDLTEHLIQSEVLNDHGIVALNKPYGVGRTSVLERNKGPVTIVQTLNAGVAPEYVPCIEETLPLLSDHYGHDMEVALYPERWSSGVLLLSKKGSLKELVQKCLRRGNAMQQPTQIFWAVTRGCSIPPVTREHIGMKLSYVHKTGNLPEITKKFSRNSVKRNLVVTNVVEHRPLAESPVSEMALMEIGVLRKRWHFLRVWMAQCYSPVFGDFLYSGRVKWISGQRILVSIHNTTAYSKPDFSAEVCKALNLKPSLLETVPCHLHLAKVKLPGFLKGKEDLEITAPPPEHFIWTCCQLGLMDRGSKDVSWCSVEGEVSLSERDSHYCSSEVMR